MQTFLLSDALREQIVREARAAFPCECCGLIEGAREGNRIRVIALHPTRNLSQTNDRFEIDPTEQFRLLRALRGTARSVIGCYHSHPNGRAEPSGHDGDGEDRFVWLIAAVSADAVTQSAFQREGGGWRKLAFVPEGTERAA